MSIIKTVKEFGIIMVLLPVMALAQNLPCRTYGGTMNERAHALVQNFADGSYIMAGFTTMVMDTNLLIVKIDSLGDTLKAKISYGNKTEIATSMIRTSDNGYALTGWTKTYQLPGSTSQKSNIFVIKLDNNLNVQWGIVYATYGDFEERAYSIIETFYTGPGFAVVGWTEYSGYNPSPALLILKLFPDGTVQWAKIYNRRTCVQQPIWTNTPTEGYDIVELSYMPPYFPNGGFAVTGRGYFYAWDAFMMCVDQVGNVVQQFCKSLMGTNDDEGYSIILDGTDLVIAGWTNTYAPQPPQGPNKANIFVWKTSLITNFDVFGKVYGWADDDEKLMDEQGLIKTNDGDYAVAGWTCSQGPGAPPNPNFLIMKVSSANGNVIWSRVHPSIPGANSEQAYPIIQTINNGYAIAGWTSSFGIAQSEDFHFLTLDQNGDRPVCVLSLMPDTFWFGTEPDSAVLFSEGLDRTTIPLKDTSVQYTKVCTLQAHVDTIDVGPTKIFFSSNPPFDSTITSTIIPSCSLYNYGNTDVSGYNVQLTIGNFYTATYTVGVNHQTHTYIQVDFPAHGSNWPRGSHTVKCTTQLNGDADHDNDLLETDIFVKVHDVGTVTINYPTGNVDSVATLTPRAKFKNYGNVLDSFPVKFVIDGPYKAIWSNETIVRVNPGYELTLDFADWTVGPHGNYLTRCSTKLNTDMDNSNNVKDSSFTVIGQLAHNVGTVTILVPTSGNIDSVATLTPKAKVKNYGSNSETFNVKFTIEGPAITTWTDDTTVTLNSSEELTIEFEDWLVGPTGNYTAKCSTELNGDEFSDNDKKQVSFTIQTPTTPGWSQRESMPPLVNDSKWHIKEGGALVGVGSNLYAFRGTKTNQFKKYVPGSGWSGVETLPFGYKYPRTNPPTPNKKFPGKGAALCYDNNNTIYATRGNGTREFWAYSISEDTWRIQESIPVPKGVKGGTALAFKGNKVYLLAGSLKKTDAHNFFEFDTTTKSWSVSESLELGTDNKPWKDGSCLTVCDGKIYALKGGDKDNLFYAFDGTAWTPKETLPKPDTVFGSYKAKVLVKAGGCMASDGSEIYAVKGGGTNVFWKYTPGTTGVWTNMVKDSVPRLHKKSVIKTGSAMAYANGKIYLLKGNKSPEFWCYTPYPKENGRAIVALMNTPSTMAKKLTAAYRFSFEVTPNPFVKLATIHYTVPIAGNVTIKLYNASGSLVKTLVNEYLNAGSYTTPLTNITRGVYFLKYESDNNRAEAKLIVR